jgi:hypothetical protein
MLSIQPSLEMRSPTRGRNRIVIDLVRNLLENRQ